MHQQNRLVVFYCVLLLSACAVHNATLQSRTTQGTSWTGQVNLKSDVIRVNAMPYYLDVEEEIIIAPYSTSGTTPTGNQSTMEMYGTFNLPANAVICKRFALAE